MTMDIASEGKQKGLLPPGRVASVYESHLVASTSGVTSIRVLAVCCGTCLIASSVLVWVHWIVEDRFSLVELGVSVPSFVVGLCACLVESGFFHEVKSTITSVVSPMAQVSGRGALYALFGMLQFLILAPSHIIIGLVTTIVGIYMIKVGRSSSKSLATLRQSITDEKALVEAFRKHDKNKDGILEIFEFEGLIIDLGIELDHDELDAAFFSIDVNSDKKIAYDEFRTWWKNCNPDHFPNESSDTNNDGGGKV